MSGPISIHSVKQDRDRHWWHAVSALLMLKLGDSYAVITDAELVRLPPGVCIAAQARPDGLHLWLVDAGGQRIATKEGDGS